MRIFANILENRRRIRSLRRGIVIRLDPSRPLPNRIVRIGRR